MKLEFIKAFDCVKVGDVKFFKSKQIARDLIEKGYAIEIKEVKEVKTERKTKELKADKKTK